MQANSLRFRIPRFAGNTITANTTKLLRDSPNDSIFGRAGDHLIHSVKIPHNKGAWKGAFCATEDKISTRIRCTEAFEMLPAVPKSFSEDAKFLSTVLVTVITGFMIRPHSAPLPRQQLATSAKFLLPIAEN
jgi:hypothetical protein